MGTRAKKFRRQVRTGPTNEHPGSRVARALAREAGLAPWDTVATDLTRAATNLRLRRRSIRRALGEPLRWGEIVRGWSWMAVPF